MSSSKAGSHLRPFRLGRPPPWVFMRLLKARGNSGNVDISAFLLQLHALDAICLARKHGASGICGGEDYHACIDVCLQGAHLYLSLIHI